MPDGLIRALLHKYNCSRVLQRPTQICRGLYGLGGGWKTDASVSTSRRYYILIPVMMLMMVATVTMVVMMMVALNSV